MEQKKQYRTPQSTYFDIEEDECFLQESNRSSAEAKGEGFDVFDEDKSQGETINFSNPINFNENPFLI